MYSLDIKTMVNANMPAIHANDKIPQDIKDAWIKLAVICNIDKLYEYYE